MDLNNIELPAFAVADLYQSSLIETGEIPLRTQTVTAAIQKEQPVSVWKSVGGNQRNVLVIVNYTDAVHLPDSDLTFLTGILGACKLSLADVAIVNRNNHPEAMYKELSTFFKSKIVLLFAVEPAAFGLPMSFPHFQVQPFANNSFLFSPALKELENDKLLKSKLWVCLKRLFNL